MAIPGLQNRISSKSPTSTLKNAASTGLSSANKVRVFTRALGSQGSIFGAYGYVPARRTIAIQDHQTLRSIRVGNMRASANAYAGRTNNGYASVSTQNTTQKSGLDVGTLLSIATVAAPSVLGMLNQIQSTKAVDTVSSHSGTSRFYTSNDNSFISSMNNAQNSVELRTAIADAQARLDELPGNIKTAKSELEDLQSKTGEYKSKYEEAQNKLNDHETNVLPKARRAKTSAESNLTKAEADCAQAEMAVGRCNLKISNLEVQLAAAPDDAKAAIKTQIDAAKAELNELMQKKSEADAAKVDAEVALDAAKAEYEEAEAETSQFEENVKNTKQDWDDNLKEIETKQKDIEKLEKEKPKLEKEIEKQKSNLNKMKNQEKAERTKLASKIEKLENKRSELLASIKTDDADGYSAKDQKNKAEADKIEQELLPMQTRFAELNELVGET